MAPWLCIDHQECLPLCQTPHPGKENPTPYLGEEEILLHGHKLGNVEKPPDRTEWLSKAQNSAPLSGTTVSLLSPCIKWHLPDQHFYINILYFLVISKCKSRLIHSRPALGYPSGFFISHQAQYREYWWLLGARGIESYAFKSILSFFQKVFKAV